MQENARVGRWLLCLYLFLPRALTVSAGAAPAETNIQGVALASVAWRFQPSQEPRSTLTALARQGEFPPPADATSSFTIKLVVNLKNFRGEKSILEIPNVVDVRLRQHDPLDRKRQNYPAFKMPDGSVPVLEATVWLHSVEHPGWTNMTIGIPLAMLQRPAGEHEVVLNFTGPDWKMYVDGEMLDNDFPFGYPRWPEAGLWKLDPEQVNQAALYVPGIRPERAPAKAPERAPGIQYWAPRGHNNWVGDVAAIFHKGTYHVFYLYDRRHHQSKFGCGAHYFEHLSTKDFKTWTEHEAATPLEEQWECIGTGTPFVVNEQLCLAYGLHTTRVYPEEKTALPAQREYLKQHGRTGTFRRASTPGVPAGATYSVSGNGVSEFKKSNLLFHPCENPSVFTAPNGKLRMLANYHSRGIWESEAVDGGWRCVSSTFPPGGDCTMFFRWGKFDYIIGGFTGLWSKPAEASDSAYEDVVRTGLDFYDGLSVPAITEITGGRFLMAGWIPIGGWGGVLVIRELVQWPDGRIGSRWMEEITPKTGKLVTLAPQLTETAAFPAEHQSFLLTFRLEPAEAKRGRLAVSFLPREGEHGGCELQIDLQDRRAHFAPGSGNDFAAREKSLREGGAPHQAGNYAIENLIGVDKPFTVRVVVKGDEKLGGSIIDAEIAGQRTMISYRPGLSVGKMLFRTSGVALKGIRLGYLRR